MAAVVVVVVVAFGSFQKQGKISQYFGGAAADGDSFQISHGGFCRIK